MHFHTCQDIKHKRWPHNREFPEFQYYSIPGNVFQPNFYRSLLLLHNGNKNHYLLQIISEIKDMVKNWGLPQSITFDLGGVSVDFQIVKT